MTTNDDRNGNGSTPPPDGARGRLAAFPLIGRVIGGPVLGNADFRRLIGGSSFNQLAMSGEQVLLGLMAFQITQSSAWVGATLALFNLPMFVFGPLSGAASDWLDRRALMRFLDLTMAVNLALFAGLIAAGFLELWLIMAFTLVSGSLRAMYAPVRLSYAYDIVGGRQVVAGLGLMTLGSRLGLLAGALIAGAVMQRLGAAAAFLVLSAAQVVAFAWLSRLQSAGMAAPATRAPLRQNLREYVAELRGNRTLAMLLVITAAVEVFGFSMTTALPELSTTRFDVGAEGLGMMHAARAVGGIVASIALAGMSNLERRGLVFLVVIYAFGASLMLLAASGQFMLALAALVVVAVLAAASDILTQSMIQLSVPNALRGRAMGTWVLAIGSAPLGHLQMGALAVALGVGGALYINGAALIAIGVLATVAAPRLRRL